MVIKDKKMYVLLAVFVVLLIGAIFSAINKQLELAAVLLICAFFSMYFFVKLNTHSSYLNPDHPKK
ncbi:MAG: hypothetical protein Q4A47_06790 [Erysipelotrichaceae bacterium]|nr:hypothetical protein [Erysipelotrichaceae bacterium]MDO5085782.1 hypothetical protein [Erysipelotrichaceae bacterium]